MNEGIVAKEITKLAVSMDAYRNATELPVGSKTVMITSYIEKGDDPNKPRYNLWVMARGYLPEKHWRAVTPTDLAIASADIAKYLNRGPELPPTVYQKSVA